MHITQYLHDAKCWKIKGYENQKIKLSEWINIQWHAEIHKWKFTKKTC